MIEFMLKS